MSKPKILLLDIETSPATAYVWKLFKENIGLNQLIEPSRMICVSWKWYGKKGIEFRSEWEHGGRMLTDLWAAIDEADAVVTYNGDSFDLRRIAGEIVETGRKPLGPITSIDLYKVVKKLGFQSGKLAYVSQLLGIGEKTKGSGFELWRGVMQGVPDARARMERYNRQDVVLLSRLYKVLRPYIVTHPYLKEDAKKDACPNCGSTHIQRRGYRRTRTMKIERLNCQTCGAWSSGAKQRIQ